MLKKILIATGNPAKLQEIKLGLKSIEKRGVTILTLANFNLNKKPEETGKSFKENAKIKAQFYSNLTNLSTIADDGGLIIPYLNNEPGVKSRRWLGYEADDEELITYTLKRLQNLPIEKRKAYLETCICFYHLEKKLTFYQQEKIEGYIAQKSSPRRIPGYPFRALFIVKKFHKYYDELTEEEHQKINHRLKAIKKILPKIIKSLKS